MPVKEFSKKAKKLPEVLAKEQKRKRHRVELAEEEQAEDEQTAQDNALREVQRNLEGAMLAERTMDGTQPVESGEEAGEVETQGNIWNEDPEEDEEEEDSYEDVEEDIYEDIEEEKMEITPQESTSSNPDQDVIPKEVKPATKSNHREWADPLLGMLLLRRLIL